MSIQTRYNKNGKVKDYRVSVDIGFLPDGRRDRKTKVCKTKKEAQRVDAQYRVLKETNEGRSNRINFEDFVEYYWKPEKFETLKKSTLKGYERDINAYLLPAFTGVPIGEINRLRIQSMINRCSTNKAGKNARETLSAILGYAVKDLQILNHNPARGTFKYKPKQEKDEDTHAMGEVITSHAEHLRLINLSESYDTKAILVLGLCFGLRKGEILGLDWQSVDMKERTIHIKQTYTYGLGGTALTDPKTPKSIRTLPMSDYAYRNLKALQDWGGISRATGAVLAVAGRRMSPTTASRRIEKFREHKEVPSGLTLGSLRHSFATAWVLSGANVASLSKWLGHTNTSTTLNRYVVPLMDDLKDEAAALDELYNKAVSF